MTFTTGVHLLAQHPESAFFVLALFPDGAQAFASFSEIGLQFGFFQSELLNHGLQLSAALSLADGFGKFSSSLTDLMFQLVDPSDQTFCAGFRLFPLPSGLCQVDLHGVELGIGVLQCRGVFFP